jgi:hypothetical protein
MVDSDDSVRVVVEKNPAIREALAVVIGVVLKLWWIVMLVLRMLLMIFGCNRRHDR